VRLPVGRETVARALAAARRFAGEGEAADRLAIVVEEWVANVIEHGRPPKASRVVLGFARRSGALSLTVSDAGRAFDPRGAEDRGPNLARGGGAGIAIIRAWCRIEAWRRAGGRNRVTLVLNA
jgi:anti-sigma regulatory factor (Ser/Thr protein kinase)